jgi:branched-chain amino acid aminotransferase
MKSFRSKIWFNGRLVDWDKANTPIITHALHYGTSVFEGIRCYKTENGPAVFRLDEHLNRLFYSASCLGMEIKLGKDDLKMAIKDLILSNGLEDCYIRPLIFYSSDQMGLLPDADKVGIAIACWPWILRPGASSGVRIMTSRFIRPHPSSVPIDAKISGHYSNSVMASQEAKNNGFDEALLLDYRGCVAEGPGENIFLVKNGALITPTKGTILAGITRDSIIRLAEDGGLRVIERDIKPLELKEVEEVFFVGTAAEIWPILEIDRIVINDGKIGDITLDLVEQYRSLVRGENDKYRQWLTFIK